MSDFNCLEAPGLEGRVNSPISSLQERTFADVGEKVRLVYAEIQERLSVRSRAVESLLEQECKIGSRLSEVLRAYGWFNAVGEKERVQLYEALREVAKERRRLYEDTFKDVTRLKADLVEALIEYRGLRRRDRALAGVGGDLEHIVTSLGENGLAMPERYVLEDLPEYRVP